MTAGRRRVLEACLLAYPQEQRARDRELLLDLALDLSADHGMAREAAGLVRAGLAARLARLLPSRRWIAATALAVSAVSTGVVVASTHTEVNADIETYQGVAE